MMATTHPEVEEYLQRLARAARVLPEREAAELIAEIREHIVAAVPAGASPGEVRGALDALGAPDDIVAAARPTHVPRRRGIREVAALVLLVSGLPPILGWLVGVVLLVASPLWTSRQKLLGILVWPGGLTGAGLLLGLVAVTPVRVNTCQISGDLRTEVASTCTSSGPSPTSVTLLIAALVVAFVAPILVGAHLYRAAGRASDPPP
jgi:hypothetical protein